MRSPRILIIICVALLAVASLPLLSSGRSRAAATSVSIVNNTSGRTVVHAYLSHLNSDDWGGNQLGDVTIGPGQSYNLTNVACDQQQVKVIAEDQDGCFLSTVVTCGDSGTWTITNDTARDCGGN
jgi:L-ascorbate metabolism protein UlaG (beta-lactamase superfamily)